MAFTDFCSVFGSFHEVGFNRIIRHVQLQRPSLFNYATADLAKDLERLCERIPVHPGVNEYDNPHVSVEDYLPIPGYNGPYGLSYSVQLTDLEIDFHPSNIIKLPPELKPPLNKQQAALRAKVCVGMACPDTRTVEAIAAQDGKEDRPKEKLPFPFKTLHCFCLELFGVVEVIRENGFIRLKLIGVEIVDIKPEGMENAMECYIATLLRLTIFPKLKIALADLVFNIDDFITLTIEPTPISGDVPFNPSVTDDRLSVFVNLS